MAIMEWSDKLNIGVSNMNDEHKVLLGYMNQLHDLCEKKSNSNVIGSALNNLVSYTIKHFSDEEEYLKSIQYPELANHKNIHKDLLKKLNEYKTQFSAQGVSVLNYDFFTFLKIWLSAHIQGIDMKYGKYSKALVA